MPIAGQIESGTYLLYDDACGTGGMLTVAEETLKELAAAHGKHVATHLYGQEINAETYAICKADLLLKGEGDAADKIVGGPEHSTLSNDAFRARLRLHAQQPALRQELEERPGAHGRQVLREYRTRLIADVVTGQVDVRAAAAGLPEEAEEADGLAEVEEPAEDEEGEELVEE